MKRVNIAGTEYKIPNVKQKHLTGGRPTVHLTRTAKMPWHDFVYALFETNELSKEKLTDIELAHLIAKEIPERHEVTKHYRRAPGMVTSLFRGMYNTSRLCRHLHPKYCSFRYDDEGYPVTSRGSLRLTTEDMRRKILEFQINDPRLKQRAVELASRDLLKDVKSIANRLKQERESRTK